MPREIFGSHGVNNRTSDDFRDHLGGRNRIAETRRVSPVKLRRLIDNRSADELEIAKRRVSLTITFSRPDLVIYLLLPCNFSHAIMKLILQFCYYLSIYLLIYLMGSKSFQYEVMTNIIGFTKNIKLEQNEIKDCIKNEPKRTPKETCLKQVNCLLVYTIYGGNVRKKSMAKHNLIAKRVKILKGLCPSRARH